MTPDPEADVRPRRTLGLLVVAHAINHAQAVLLPLIYLRIIDEWGVSVAAIGLLATVGNFSSGIVQVAFGAITRVISRRAILGAGGILFGAGFAGQALASTFGSFSLVNVVSRIGGSPQHPVGNGLLAEQFPPARRGFAISAHIAGGNVGTVFGLAGAWLIATFGWRLSSVLFGVPAIVLAVLILGFVRESGADRAAARASGTVRDAYARAVRTPGLLWIFLTSILGGGGRGLGVVNLFALLYLSHVLRLDETSTNLMYAALIVLSVPAPLVAGWLSDRLGRKPLIIGVYLGGAVGFLAFLAAGSSLLALWLAITVMGAFSFAESPQLQALLADVAAPDVRDAAFGMYFTLAFGVGALWGAVYSAVIYALGEAVGLPVVFVIMAISFVLAAAAMLPVPDPPLARETVDAAVLPTD
jgi:MFS family permease